MAIPQNVQSQADFAAKLMKGDISVGTVVDPNNPANVPAPQPAPVAAPEGSENWQHKYLVLQGKYNTEISSLRASLAEKDGVVSQLNRMVADLYERIGSNPPQGDNGGRAEPTQRPKEHVPRELTFEKVSEDDFSGYGDEVRILVRNQNALIDKIANLEGTVKNVEGTAVKSKWEAFSDRMRARMPDWETVNSDPAFIGWLGEKANPRDPWTRMDALKHYASQGDDGHAIEYFKEFKQVFVTSNPQTPGYQAPPISELVQPQISGSTPQTPVNAKPIGTVTPEQFKKATDDFTHKLITYDEWKAVSDAFQKSLKAQSMAGR